MVRVSDSFSIQGRITVRQYDVMKVLDDNPSWDTMCDSERLSALDRQLAESEYTTANIPLDNLLNFIAKVLSKNDDGSEEISHLALGDGSTNPDGSNTTLNNEVYRTIIGSSEVDGSDLLTSTLISQTEANGYTISEIGLASGSVMDQDLLTHAVFESGEEIEKNSGMVVTIDYILQIQR